MDKKEGLLIKDCVNDGKIQLMDIPIILESDEDDSLKAYEVLDDYKEALGKIGYFESINVWAREEEITGYALCVEESSASIIGGYTLGGFRNQFDYASYTPVQTTYVEKTVITNESNMVLPYNESCVVLGNYY